MESLSTTWQHLPKWLQKPVMAGVLTLAEASEMWDNVLTATQDFNPLPRHLWSAAQRLHPFESSPSPTVH